MNKQKIRSLDTIAFLRETAAGVRLQVPEARAVASKFNARKSVISDNIRKVLGEEADKLETIAADLEAMADEAANYRAFATARFLMGPVALVSEQGAMPVIKTIRESPAFMEHTAPLSPSLESRCTVRLVPFYDPTLGEERWALHYFNTDGDEGISDNASQEDAEQRYWDIAGPLGQERTG